MDNTYEELALKLMNAESKIKEMADKVKTCNDSWIDAEEESPEHFNLVPVLFYGPYNNERDGFGLYYEEDGIPIWQVFFVDNQQVVSDFFKVLKWYKI